MSKTIERVKKTRKIKHAIISDEMQKFPEAASVGDTFRQGDIYITLIDGTPKNCEPVTKPSNQLAPGNTQGSRHCMKSMRGVSVYSLKNQSVYDGPILEVKTKNIITHPEHGDVEICPGVYAISYQRTEDSEGRQRRVQD